MTGCWLPLSSPRLPPIRLPARRPQLLAGARSPQLLAGLPTGRSQPSLSFLVALFYTPRVCSSPPRSSSSVGCWRRRAVPSPAGCHGRGCSSPPANGSLVAAPHKLAQYLVPVDLTVGQFVYVVRKQIKISAEKTIFIFVKNTLPPTVIFPYKGDFDGWRRTLFGQKGTNFLPYAAQQSGEMPNNSRTTVQANPVGGALHDAPKRNTSELTFLSFEDPVCIDDGSIFDLMSIVPYIKKFWKHPVTRALLDLEDLMPLTFHKNSDGEFQCSILNKVFMEFTRIVAVKNAGNVFYYEAIQEINIKPKNWK
ncbi:hypothetical protein GUJ93_ZPchr0010g9831 [Zizania palustris]|uniref:Autophagy-related protein n=1 Tax=Zizania palustris TaxID=103762 RepID=A0A8J5WDG5_ZIZPA|nr:hypothetical protein GUJ93_ZPchr0010g9831 [Zizania palustris]